MTIIVKVPVENSNDMLGCRKTPDKIISNFSEIYMNENGKQILKDSIIVKEIELSGKNESECSDEIYQKSFEELSNGEKVFFIGGDHSITYSIVKAFRDVCSAERNSTFLIVFDAHPDCRKCPSNDKKSPNNLQWLRKLVEEGFPAENIIIIGLRSYTMEEIGFINEKKILTYPMKNVLDFQEICDIVMEIANKHQIYVSIDIDVLDSVFVPGTSRPEAGGFTSRQLIYFIQRLNLLKNTRVFDLTEINPEIDFRDVTIKLGTKIAGEVI